MISDVEQVPESDLLIQSDRKLLVFLLLDVKKGTDIEMFLDSRDDMKEFCEFLEDRGIEYHVEEEVDNTKAGKLLELVDEERETSLTDRDFPCRFFMTREREALQRYVRHMEGWRRFQFKLRPTGRYHRDAGRFYGYPEEDIEAFLASRNSFTNRIKRALSTSKEPGVIDQTEAVEKHGQELSERDRNTFVSFTDHLIADTRESFERQLEAVLERRKAMEDAGIDPDRFIDQGFQDL
ncbi:MAG: hypothetical protein ABEJ03_01025 [Candidatus Nanohaloarchaea archaeon]